MQNAEQRNVVQECDATGDASSTAAGTIIFIEM